MKGRWVLSWKDSAGNLDGFSIKDDYEGSVQLLRCVEWLSADDSIARFNIGWARTA